MSDTATSVQDRAREACGWFEVARRNDSSPFVRVRDGAPKWVRQLVYHAHGGDFLPDDWRYAKIHDALEFIAETDPGEDGDVEFANDAVDVYTSDRLAWLSSNLDRADYCDNASAEMGAPGSGIVERIGYGQFAEATEIYGLVLNYLQDNA